MEFSVVDRKFVSFSEDWHRHSSLCKNFSTKTFVLQDPALAGIYRLACQRINCPPNAAVAVEDAAAGVRAAKDAVLRCIGIASCGSEEKLTAAGADCVLRDFVNLTLQEFQSLVGMQPQSSGTPECEAP